MSDKIIAERVIPAEGVVYLPDSYRDAMPLAKVISVGPDVRGVEKGDTVLYSKYEHDEISFAGQELLIIQCGDVLAVVEDVEKEQDEQEADQVRG